MPPGSTKPSATPTMGQLLAALLAARDLTRLQAAQLVSAMLDADTPDAQIAAALALLVAKGETPDELAGLADALYQRVLPIAIPSQLLDTAGTGASTVKTFNVSTAASFVIAAAGCANWESVSSSRPFTTPHWPASLPSAAPSHSAPASTLSVPW